MNRDIAIMSNSDLRAEIEALRREVAAIRAQQQAVANPVPAPSSEDSSEPAPAGLTEQLQALVREISEFAEDPERDNVERVLAGRLVPVQTLADKTLWTDR